MSGFYCSTLPPVSVSLGVWAHLQVSVHEPFAVQKVHSLSDLKEDVQTLAVLPLLREAALGHPVLQVLLPTELHLDVQVHLPTGRVGSVCVGNKWLLSNKL